MPFGLGLGLGLGAPGGGEATPAPTVPVLIGSRGAFVLNGQAAELRAVRRMTAAAGSFALTGNAAGVAAARMVTAAAGSFALTGNATAPIVAPYVANAWDFNEATPDYLTRATDFVGNADAYTGTFSCWFRRDAQGTVDRILASESNFVRIQLASNNTLNFLFNSPTSEQFQFTSTGTYLSSATWRWIGASWNMNFAAGNKIIHVYDDAGAIAGSNTDAAAAFMVDYTRVGWAVASSLGGLSPLNGCLSEVFFAPGQFIDLSIAGNRAKFISGGKPVYLGPDGSTPLGVVPLLYLRNPAATCNVNSGSGGNMTISGAPAVASTSPSN